MNKLLEIELFEHLTMKTNDKYLIKLLNWTVWSFNRENKWLLFNWIVKYNYVQIISID